MLKRKVNREKYSGIILVSSFGKGYLTFYLPRYDGQRKYVLRGSKREALSDKSNAVYLQGDRFWVSSESPAVSFIQITSDSDGKLSGTYDVTVYHEGHARYGGELKQGVRLKGAFTDLPIRAP